MIKIVNYLPLPIDDYVSTNNVKFYFDYQDGSYGYNTSSTRGADTFSPFKSGGNVRTENLGNKTATTNNSAAASTSYNISNITRSEIVSIYTSAVFDSSHYGYVIVMRSAANTFGYKVQQAVSNFYVDTSVSGNTISISVTTGGTVYTGASLSINCIINVV